MKKILIIRFSSIGDIVLTTPVVRCLKKQLPEAEIHYLTKKKFLTVLQNNPYIDKLHCIEHHIKEVLPELKKEKYDHIIDLHKNLRTLHLKTILRRPVSSFKKLNKQKWLLVKFKINRLPNVHIVDRYMDTIKFLGVKNDGQGLDYFIPEDEQIGPSELPIEFRDGFVGAVIGGKHKTKLFPTEKWIELIGKTDLPFILLGGPEDEEEGEKIAGNFGLRVMNSCGKFTLNQSASLVEIADHIVTNDTGLMHIAAAFKKPIVSVWGNTVPEFGMYPYLPYNQIHKMSIIQVSDLKCRPCSKIGYKKCPKGHFDCMQKVDVDQILEEIQA